LQVVPDSPHKPATNASCGSWDEKGKKDEGEKLNYGNKAGSNHQSEDHCPRNKTRPLSIFAENSIEVNSFSGSHVISVKAPSQAQAGRKRIKRPNILEFRSLPH
jgi:hypothetical protein